MKYIISLFYEMFFLKWVFIFGDKFGICKLFYIVVFFGKRNIGYWLW